MIRYYFKNKLDEDESYRYEIIEHDYIIIDDMESLHIASNIKHESFIVDNYMYRQSSNSLIEYGTLVSNPSLKNALNIYLIKHRSKKLNKIKNVKRNL